MDWKKAIAALLALSMLLLFAVACQRGEETPGDSEETEEATEGPIPQEQQTDYTDDPERVAYIESFGTVFAAFPETDPQAFTMTEAEGGVTVTGYTGKETAVRVPSIIDGKPVVAVGDAAFAQNTVLQKLYLPDGITTVGTGILAGCSSLTALRTPILGKDDMQYLGYLFGANKYEDNPICVPASLEYLELGGNAVKLPDFALFDCNDLVYVSFPDTLKALGSYAMFQCSSLLALNVQGLTSIGEHALDRCASLTTLTFGEGLQSIGFGALEGCINLRSLTLPFVGGSATEQTYLGYIFGAATPDFAAGYYPAYLVELTLLSTCTSLGNYAFYECDSLLRITLPQTLTSIGIRAFSYCTRLEGIAVPDGVTRIGENAFFGCKKLQTLTFGSASALNEIGINAFYGCVSMTSVSLPQTLTALPASCFANCTALATVDLGGVTRVGKNAFHNCVALHSLTAPDGVVLAEGNEYAARLLEDR